MKRHLHLRTRFPTTCRTANTHVAVVSLFIGSLVSLKLVKSLTTTGTGNKHSNSRELSKLETCFSNKLLYSNAESLFGLDSE